MIEHILVCPFDKQLLAKFKHRTIVINTNDFNSIRNINDEVNKSNKLYAIKIQTGKSFSSIPFRKDWGNIPLAVYSPEFGSYKEFLHQLNLIRKLNIRIFLSSHSDFNFTGLRILSSLNIGCGIYFNGEPYKWDLMNDLMHYAIYSMIKHASLEPFNWLASNYEQTGYTDYNIVYFNHPSKYLHVNEKEQIALTEKDMLNKNYIDEGIDSLDNICENKKYTDFLNYRYEIMLQMNECAFCPAFRICLGKFSELPDKSKSCKTFFSDFLDAADYSFSKRNNENQVWQL